MAPLAWLGLRKRGQHPNLSQIQERVRELLPDDEPVVIRYIVIVAVLLTRVAYADGRFLKCELDHLRALFKHIDRMPDGGIDVLCDVLNEVAPSLPNAELELCFRELKALCDGTERQQVMRLLTSQAKADGQIASSEHAVLRAIAAELDIPNETMDEIELSALAGEVVAVTVDSQPKPEPEAQVDG